MSFRPRAALEVSQVLRLAEMFEVRPRLSHLPRLAEVFEVLPRLSHLPRVSRWVVDWLSW